MTEVTEESTLLKHWHGVLDTTDHMASEPASVDLVCMLTRFVRPKVVVEAGTYRGHLMLAVANILRQMEPSGVIYSADPVDLVSKTLAAAPELHPYLRYHNTDFSEMMGTLSEPIDLAYIDASSVENPHLRWEHATAVYLRLSPGGLMVIDDTESPDWEDARRFRNWGSNVIHLPHYRGLTMIQKAV